MNKIKVIVLDWGGVLIDNPAESLIHFVANDKGLDVKTVKVFIDQHLCNLQKGVWDEKQFLERMGEELSENISLEPVWKRAAKACFTIKKEVIEKIDVWKKAGLEIGFLSNTEKPAQELFYEWNWNSKFDQLFFSCDLNLLKPDPSIYQKVIQSFNVPSQEILFIDDKLENVEGARVCQMSAWQYQSDLKFAEFSRELEKAKYDYSQI